ncbi:MAG: pirin-like C-terminal cupin domain-containing protein [Pseudomonadota bacterium]|nr:pirin-like C-terminal cupin domain-containing protein [Pseudomonadota bacterium]
MIDDPHTQLLYLDIALAPEAHFEYVLPAGHNAFLYLFEGDALVDEDTPIPLHTLAVLNPGDILDLEAGEGGARFILVAGRCMNLSRSTGRS